VLHDELHLLQAAVSALRRLIEIALRGTARALLGLLLVHAAELLDLLAKLANVMTKRIDDRIELRIEVFVTDEAYGLFRVAKYRLRNPQQHEFRTTREHGPTRFDTAHGDRIGRPR
jgi:hypothetical protein